MISYAKKKENHNEWISIKSKRLEPFDTETKSPSTLGNEVGSFRDTISLAESVAIHPSPSPTLH